MPPGKKAIAVPEARMQGKLEHLESSEENVRSIQRKREKLQSLESKFIVTLEKSVFPGVHKM